MALWEPGSAWARTEMNGYISIFEQTRVVLRTAENETCFVRLVAKQAAKLAAWSGCGTIVRTFPVADEAATKLADC